MPRPLHTRTTFGDPEIGDAELPRYRDPHQIPEHDWRDFASAQSPHAMREPSHDERMRGMPALRRKD